MTFLHLAMLGGLALGAVPIIIHILTRRRHKTVRWGAMKYLLAAIEENRKRVQIEDLILLALRVLIVLLLVLALARPRLTGSGVGAGSGPRLVVLLVDNSPSMQARRGGSSRLEVAKAWGQELLKRLDKGSAVAVVPMAGPVGAATGVTEPTRELGFAARAIGELAASGRRADPAAALRAAREALGRSELSARTVCIVSDFQAADWQGGGPAVGKELAELLKAKGLDLVAVQCSGGELANTAVTGLSRAGRIIRVDTPARISALLTSREAGAGTAGREAPEVNAVLEVDGRTADSRSTRLAAGESREVAFYAAFSGEGPHAVTLRSAPDISPADDVRYLAADAREEVRVLVVDGDPHPDEDFLSESFYLRFALSPGASALSPITVRTASPEEFAGEDLAAYDLVILANLERIEPTRARDLAAAVRGGRAAIVFLGELCDPEAYNRTIFGGGPDALLSARLGPASAVAESGGYSLAKAGLSGPVMGFFKSTGGLDAVRASRSRELDLATAPQASVEARLVPGEIPFLVTAQVGEGRVAFVNSTADAQWSNLPLKPAFTAMVQRLAVWLLEPRSRCQNLLAGEKYRLSLPLTAVRTTVSVKLPDKRTAALAPVVPAERAERATVEFADTAVPGCYEFTWNAEGGPERRLLAVNIDPVESDLTTLEPGALRELAAGAQLAWMDATDPGGQAALFKRGGREFWRAVFIAMLVLLAAETFLGRRFSGAGQKRAAQAAPAGGRAAP